ncbi:hypothetical protein WMF11_12130 [Sorangium sp. So ce295]|uniref:hypothetical protein n=1 Tax=Sorangium sp. So ce295 TaxID=3133295 RepID=UPI003F5F3F11
MDQPVPGDSRAQQADVAGALAERAFDALGVLLRGFEDAAERDGAGALEDALARGPEHLHGGLLTAILRLVFLLHAEDRGSCRSTTRTTPRTSPLRGPAAPEARGGTRRAPGRSAFRPCESGDPPSPECKKCRL